MDRSDFAPVSNRVRLLLVLFSYPIAFSALALGVLTLATSAMALSGIGMISGAGFLTLAGVLFLVIFFVRRSRQPAHGRDKDENGSIVGSGSGLNRI